MIARKLRNASLLDAMATVGAAGAAELAALSGIGEPATRVRLRGLAAEGLVRASRVLYGEPALYALTRRGLLSAGARSSTRSSSGRQMQRILPPGRGSPWCWRGRGTV